MSDESNNNNTRNEGTNRNNSRRRPNVLITGTPGVGKTALASLIVERLEPTFRHVNVGELIQQHKCYDGRDEALDTNILDEDKLLDIMEPLLQEAEDENVGVVADFHVSEMFPERWFDLVLVLRASTEVLYDRLGSQGRGYSGRKLEENMHCEIMQVILDEAREAYDADIVHEVPSNTVEDMESNMKRIADWSKQWILDRMEDDDSAIGDCAEH
jgi:adenylate kinase